MDRTLISLGRRETNPRSFTQLCELAGGIRDVSTSQIRAELPQTRILVVSVHATEHFVRRAFKAGHRVIWSRTPRPLELPMAIEAIMRGERYVTSRVSNDLLSGLVEGRLPGQSSIDPLSRRQREILQLVAEGKSTKEIAFLLGLSAKTVAVDHRRERVTPT